MIACYLIHSLTFLSGLSAARALDTREVTVLLPTPPFPESMRTLFLTDDNLSFTKAIPGSGNFVAPEEQIFWFGHPAQAETFPALSLCVPGQSEKKYIYFTCH